jgi:hypothetical protein
VIVHVVFMVDGVGVRQVFPDNFSFRLIILIASVFHTHLSTGAGTVRPLEAARPRALRHPTPRNEMGK